MLNGMTSPLAFPHALMVIIAKRYALLFREREPFSFHSSYAATNTCASVNTAFVGACKIPRKEVGITRVHVFVRFVLARVRVRVSLECAIRRAPRACVGAWVIKRGVPLAELTRVSTHPTLACTIAGPLLKSGRRSRRWIAWPYRYSFRFCETVNTEDDVFELGLFIGWTYQLFLLSFLLILLLLVASPYTMNRENLFLRVGTTRRIRTKRYNDSKAVRRVCSRDRLTLVRGEKQRFSTVILRLEREREGWDGFAINHSHQV